MQYEGFNGLLTSKMTLLGILGLKFVDAQESALKLNSRMSFYYHYLVA